MVALGFTDVKVHATPSVYAFSVWDIANNVATFSVIDPDV